MSSTSNTDIKSPEEGVCLKCGECEAQEDHLCPFAREISDNQVSLCNCCKACTSRCAEDI
jgi:hypothetical protein